MPNTTNKTRTLSEGGAAARSGIVKALDKASEADPFLGDVIEIAIVTRDHKRAMEGLWRLGIGPWQVHTFTPENTTNQTYRGQPSPFALRVCFASLGNIIWELIEPLSGPTIFAEFSRRARRGNPSCRFQLQQHSLGRANRGVRATGLRTRAVGKLDGPKPLRLFRNRGCHNDLSGNLRFPA